MRGMALIAASKAVSARAQFSAQAQRVISVYTNSGPSTITSFPNGACLANDSLNYNFGDGAVYNGSSKPAHTYAADGTKVIQVGSSHGWGQVTAFTLQAPNGGNSPFTYGTASVAPTLIAPFPDITMLFALQTFQSCDTWWTGPLPYSSLAFAPNLVHYDTQGNLLSGSAPTISSNPLLQYCDFHVNGYTGSVPIIKFCPLLTYYEAHVNNFSGGLPSDFFSNSALLQHFGFGNAWGFNNAMGTFPSVSLLTALTYFQIDDTGNGGGFSGTLPSFANSTLLTSWSAFGNTQLTGVTAGSFATQASLATLNLNDLGLSSAAVNQVLADLVTSLGLGGRVACTVNLSGGTSGAPTGTGITNKATLITAGWTVTTN